jgi:hypothetical protein
MNGIMSNSDFYGAMTEQRSLILYNCSFLLTFTQKTAKILKVLYAFGLIIGEISPDGG